MMTRKSNGSPAQRLVGALTLSRTQLARQLNVSPGTLYSWMVGRRRPGPKNVERLIEVAEQHARTIVACAAELSRSPTSRDAGRESSP